MGQVWALEADGQKEWLLPADGGRRQLVQLLDRVVLDDRVSLRYAFVELGIGDLPAELLSFPLVVPRLPERCL